MNWTRQAIYAVIGACLLSPLAAPQLLAFPYSAQVGAHRVYSDSPIVPQVRTIVERADRVAARSPIALPRSAQPVFLTNGGWRWSVLTLTSRSAFAISRAPFETIIVNRSDLSNDEAFRPAKVGGARSLTATLAHEMSHGAIRAHFGPFADFRYPAWLREGYCDYVAGGGSISDIEAKALMRDDPGHPALVYWRGRKRIESVLERSEGSIEALFHDHGA